MPTPPDYQYPANAISRRVLPTSVPFIVTKFDVNEGFRSEDEIDQEAGLLNNVIGTDVSLSGDIEIVVTPNANLPQSLTTLVFNTAAATPNYANFANANILTMLIRGEVKPMGSAGKGLKYGFKVFKNSVLPTTGPG
jgi:adenine-specific DNA methylase